MCEARREPRVGAQYGAFERHARHGADTPLQVAVHDRAQLTLPQLQVHISGYYLIF